MEPRLKSVSERILKIESDKSKIALFPDMCMYVTGSGRTIR